MAHSYNFTPGDRDAGGQATQLFKSLEFTESRQRSLWMSIAVHGTLLAGLLLVPLIFTEAIKLRYDTVLLSPPPPKKDILEVTPYKAPPPKPKPEPKREKPIVAPPPVKPIVVKPPEIKPPELKPPEPPKIAEVKMPDVIARAKPTPRLEEAPPTPAPPKMEVRTGAFSTGSSAKPTTNLPAAQVQTGGFGDPNGIKGEGKPGKVANIASLGSFDLPTGPGAGNGTGGARGVRGTVASAGFGNGVAPVGGGGGGGGGNGGGSGRTVQQGGFGDADAVKPETPKRRVDSEPAQTPVEILFKPKPDYTDEARRMKLEGEVLVRVLFTAAGDVRVLDVVRGLGHGLDENALRAAQQIKFKPAQRDGRPVDSTATVRIVFQLAY